MRSTSYAGKRYAEVTVNILVVVVSAMAVLLCYWSKSPKAKTGHSSGFLTLSSCCANFYRTGSGWTCSTLQGLRPNADKDLVHHQPRNNRRTRCGYTHRSVQAFTGHHSKSDWGAGFFDVLTAVVPRFHTTDHAQSLSVPLDNTSYPFLLFG